MLHPTPQKICQDLCTWHNALNLGKSQIDFEQFKRYNVELRVSVCSRICAHFPEILRASTEVINIFWNYSKSNKYYYTNFVQLLDLLCIVSSWTYKLLFIGSSWSGFCKKSPFRYYKSFDRVSDTINHLIGSPRDCGFLKIPSDTINHMIGSPRDCGFLKIPSDTINHLIWSPRVLRD